MSRRNAEQKAAEPEVMISVPVRLPMALDRRIKAAADQTTLGKQAVMRLAMERGIDVLLAQLKAPVAGV